MAALIVTHQRPDLDACTAVWLVRTFIEGFATADIVYVPAGGTYENKIADTDPRIIHVDTGLGKFDHHQLSERSSAAERIVAQVIKTQRLGENTIAALERLAEVVTAVDNFEEALLPQASDDFYDLGLHQLLRGLKITKKEDSDIMQFGLDGVESFFMILKNKAAAELDIAQGVPFDLGTVKALGIMTRNEEALILAQKNGYGLVIRKDPSTGNARIKARPDSSVNLKAAYEEIKKQDTKGHWFLHGSGKMLLNASDKGGSTEPTKLTLQNLIRILQDTV